MWLRWEEVAKIYHALQNVGVGAPLLQSCWHQMNFNDGGLKSTCISNVYKLLQKNPTHFYPIFPILSPLNKNAPVVISSQFLSHANSVDNDNNSVCVCVCVRVGASLLEMIRRLRPL